MSDPCPLCGGTERPLISSKDRHGKPLNTVICVGCGIVTNNPIPSDEELAEFYCRDYRTEYKGTAEPRMRQIWRNFGRVSEHILAFRDLYDGRRHCLDLGSGSGEFMYLANQLDIDCLGVEPNDGYSAYCRDKLGLNVLNQTLEESGFKPGQFDLIRLSHVLEHMRDPVRSLNVLRDWLSDDGVLYIEVPNIDQEAANKMRGKIFHYGHIFNFSPSTLRMTALMAGLEEHPLSAGRNDGEAAGFFRKAAAPSAVHDIIDKPKARHTFQALKAHNKRAMPAPAGGTAFGRGISTLRLRLSEVIAARKFSKPVDIAEHFAARLTGGVAQ